MRRPAVHVADQPPEGHDELEVAHVLVGVVGRGHVVEHQVEPGYRHHDEEEERQTAQAEGVGHPDPGAAHADRVDMEDEVRERRAGRDLVGQR